MTLSGDAVLLPLKVFLRGFLVGVEGAIEEKEVAAGGEAPEEVVCRVE